MIKKIYHDNKKLINYIFFGIVSSIVCMGSYYLLTITILNPKNPIELQIANIISWILAVLVAYITNRKYVFNSKSNKIIKEAIKFFASRIITLLLDIFIMFLGVTLLHYNDRVIKIISQVLVVTLNYVFSKIFVFKEK